MVGELHLGCDGHMRRDASRRDDPHLLPRLWELSCYNLVMPVTARELSPEDYHLYNPAAAIQNRTKSQTQKIKKLREEALNAAREAAGLLKEKYGAHKVVVFGSLLPESQFTEWSDIDLAAWGIPDERFYGAVADVSDISERFKIDLVDLDSCRSSLVKVIEQTGMEI